jgi:hypothetical protein
MPDDDEATSTKDKTIIIHNHIYTDTNKGNGPTKNHVQLQRTITRDEELEDVQTLADNHPRVVLQGFVVDLLCHFVVLWLVVGMLYPYVVVHRVVVGL